MLGNRIEAPVSPLGKVVELAKANKEPKVVFDKATIADASDSVLGGEATGNMPMRALHLIAAFHNFPDGLRSEIEAGQSQAVVHTATGDVGIRRRYTLG